MDGSADAQGEGAARHHAARRYGGANPAFLPCLYPLLPEVELGTRIDGEESSGYRALLVRSCSR